MNRLVLVGKGFPAIVKIMENLNHESSCLPVGVKSRNLWKATQTSEKVGSLKKKVVALLYFGARPNSFSDVWLAIVSFYGVLNSPLSDPGILKTPLGKIWENEDFFFNDALGTFNTFTTSRSYVSILIHIMASRFCDNCLYLY